MCAEAVAQRHTLGQRRDLEESKLQDPSGQKLQWVIQAQHSEFSRRSKLLYRYATSTNRTRAGGGRLPMCIASQAKPRTSSLSYFHQLTNSISD